MLETNPSLVNKAYEDYTALHATFLLHIVQARQLEPLSAQVVEKMAKAMIYCGSYFPQEQEPLLPRIMTFIYSVLDCTSNPKTKVDDAIKSSCMSELSIPVICPATTTVCALYYLNKFKQKFGIFTQHFCVYQRLFLVAYLVAAKFIHANLKLLVAPSLYENYNRDVQQTSQPNDHYVPYIPSTTDNLQSATTKVPRSPSEPFYSRSCSTSASETSDCLSMSPSTSTDDNDDDDTSASFRENATQLLVQLGGTFRAKHSITAASLCSMEIEFLHFLDYQLQLGPSNPLHLWSWFDTTLDHYCHCYHKGLGMARSHDDGNSNKKATTATL